jgi:CheY-like chemotaxis protein
VELLARTPSVRAVVLDVVMPEMDGLETYDRLRAIRPDLKVLFVSGFAPERTERELARRGLPFLAKPADPARLALELYRLLSKPEAEKAPA